MGLSGPTAWNCHPGWKLRGRRRRPAGDWSSKPAGSESHLWTVLPLLLLPNRRRPRGILVPSGHSTGSDNSTQECTGGPTQGHTPHTWSPDQQLQSHACTHTHTHTHRFRGVSQPCHHTTHRLTCSPTVTNKHTHTGGQLWSLRSRAATRHRGATRSPNAPHAPCLWALASESVPVG